MAQVVVKVNGRDFALSCPDGQEARIRHQVLEGNADEQPQVGQEALHVGRHFGFGVGGGQLVGTAQPFPQTFLTGDPGSSHG